MDIDDGSESTNDGTEEKEASYGRASAERIENVAARDLGLLDTDMAETRSSTLLPHTRLGPVLHLDTTVAGSVQSSIGTQANGNSIPALASFSPLHQPHSPGFTGNPLSDPYSPLSPHYSGDSRSFSPGSPISPNINPVSPNYSPTSYITAWYTSSTDFEVRLIRYRRNRVG